MKVSEERKKLIEWAEDRFEKEVKNRPDTNVHKRCLETTWKQVINKLKETE